MKKIILCGVMLTLAAFASSCKKDYQCHCKKTANQGEDHFVVRAKKKDAAAACEAYKTANPSSYSSCVID